MLSRIVIVGAGAMGCFLAARLAAEVGCRGELRRQRPHGILLAVGLNDTARVGRPDGRPQLAEDAFLFGLQQLPTHLLEATGHPLQHIGCRRDRVGRDKAYPAL